LKSLLYVLEAGRFIKTDFARAIYVEKYEEKLLAS